MEKLNEKNRECCFMKPLTIVAIVLSSISILLSVFTLGSGMGRHRNDFHMQRPYGVQSEMRENCPNNNNYYGQKPNKPKYFNSQNNDQNQPNGRIFDKPNNNQSSDKPSNSNNSGSGINTPSNNGPTVSPSISPTTAPW